MLKPESFEPNFDDGSENGVARVTPERGLPQTIPAGPEPDFRPKTLSDAARTAEIA